MSEANEVSNGCHTYIRRLNDIQIALDLKKIKYTFMTIFGLPESFKTMNRPDPTVTLFDGLFLGKYER